MSNLMLLPTMQSQSPTVTLTEVIASIADQVPVPDDDLRAIHAAASSPLRHSPSLMGRASVGHAVLEQLLEVHLQELYRLDVAAASLHFFILEAASIPGRTPAWRYRGPTGMPVKLQDPTEIKRAYAFLESKSLSAKQRYEDYRFGALMTEFAAAADAGCLTIDSEREWGQHLEFARADISDLLDWYDVPHSLHNQPFMQPAVKAILPTSGGQPPRYLRSPEIAEAFKDLKWTAAQWAVKLASSKGGWLLQARRSQGARGGGGNATKWDPVAIAVSLHMGEAKKRGEKAKGEISGRLRKRLDGRFDRCDTLREFRKAWEKHSLAYDGLDEND